MMTNMEKALETSSEEKIGIQKYIHTIAKNQLTERSNEYSCIWIAYLSVESKYISKLITSYLKVYEKICQSTLSEDTSFNDSLSDILKDTLTDVLCFFDDIPENENDEVLLK